MRDPSCLRAPDDKGQPILVIQTGGTIAMVPGPQGLHPDPRALDTAPALRRLGGRAQIRAIKPQIDSASIGPAGWNAMLDLIDEYPGLPVLLTHGTDTMAFTGAALARALAGTGRRVVLCGSMTPLGAGTGEAEANLETAIAALDMQRTGASPAKAGSDMNGFGSAISAGASGFGPGVWLAFDGQILAAAGLVKHHASARAAFRSVAQDPLPMPVRRRFDGRKLAILTLSPGLPAPAVRATLDALDGAVLRVFGAGTVMQDAALIDVLRAAVSAGKRLRAVSQCEAGGLAQGAYEAGQALWDAGVVSGGRETPEAALMHLWLMD
ncbi:MAG: asparaginase [Roseinatronobacter sp.]